MNDNLKKIIESSSFVVHEGNFVYTKVSTAPSIEQHFLVCKDSDEITVVTKEEHLTRLDVIERNKDVYSLIELRVSVPFYSVGFLATISSKFAEEGLNILIVSTYSKDYIMVRVEHTKIANRTLINLGLTKK